MAGSLSVAAAAEDFPAERVVDAVEQGDLIAVVNSLGHRVRDVGVQGQVFVSAETPQGYVYLLFGSACGVDGAPGCRGIMMQLRYDLPATTTPETLAKANLEQGAINTIADFDAGTLVFLRYHVLDHGATMANIRENVKVLLAVHEEAYPIAAGQE